MSDVPQGPILELAFFNMLKQDSGTVRLSASQSFNGFACDTKLSGEADTVERRDAIQWDLDTLEKWARDNLMRFNKADYKALYFD